jgi:RsiW-degrading membrane proteinase PrsW (M82 family)
MIIDGLFIAAAVLPALILMRYIYRQDAIEREPKGLLFSLVVAGAFAVIPVTFLEYGGQYLLSLFVPSDTPLFMILLMFLVVAPSEEGCKYYFLKRKTWRHPAFNYRFDGLVYAVFVSLGFAALENIGYVTQFGLSVAATRAVLSVPAHMSFAVFMGSYYGRAKVREVRGDHVGAARLRQRGLWIAILLHGFFNSCLVMNDTRAMLVFIGFVLIMYGVVFRRIKSDAKNDIGFHPAEDMSEAESQGREG